MVLLLGLGSSYLDRPVRPQQLELTPEQVFALSDLLRHGDVVGPHGTEMLDAILDPVAWDRLSAEERRTEADALAHELKRQVPLDAAAVRRPDGSLVMLIQRGTVVFVL